MMLAGLLYSFFDTGELLLVCIVIIIALSKRTRDPVRLYCETVKTKTEIERRTWRHLHDLPKPRTPFMKELRWILTVSFCLEGRETSIDIVPFSKILTYYFCC